MHPHLLRRPSHALLGKACLAFGLLAAWTAPPAHAFLSLLSKPVMAPSTVQTSQGPVAGKVANGARAFLGIPFAAPPVGDRRWQAPQAAQPWTDTRQATTPSADCMQPNNAIAGKVMAEDCLYLNVHLPDDIGPGERLPVMVWLHGGGFLTGSGGTYDMAQLARKGRVVVVSPNYRLGALGFFRLPEQGPATGEAAPANIGLMDQQAALRWVQSEIGQFGGDPSRVTLFGQSAGAAAVCMHMVAPGSAGLFQRAIMQSGLCTPVGAPNAPQLATHSARLAEAVGCPPVAGQMDCLRAKPAADIVAASASDGDVLSGGLNWAPVADGVTLPADPTRMVREGRLQRVPVLMGSNRDEGRYYVAMSYHLKNLLPVSSKQFDEALTRGTEGDAALAARAAEIYTPRAYGTRDKALGALITDLLFVCRVMRQTEDLAEQTEVYHYEFSEANTPGMFNPFMVMGAFHAVELRYIFQTKLAGPTFNLPLSAAQQKLADQMLGYWAGFAASGQPRLDGAPAWPRFAPSSATSLVFQSKGLTLTHAAAFRADHHCELWDGRSPGQR